MKFPMVSDEVTTNQHYKKVLENLVGKVRKKEVWGKGFPTASIYIYIFQIFICIYVSLNFAVGSQPLH